MRATARIFLSSTSADLKEFRAAAREGLEGAGFQCIWMEGFNPQSQSPAQYVQALIADCDAVVFLIGPCYGSIVPDHLEKQVSFTELEYDVAKRLQKPCLVFMTDDDFAVPANVILADKHTGDQEVFRNKLQQELVRQTFKRPEQLKALIVTAIHEQTTTGQWSPRVTPLSCVVLCGGLATRLAPLTRDTCKEAIPVAGVSALERMIQKLDQDGVAKNIIVSALKQHEKQISALLKRVRTSTPVRLVGNTCSGPLQAVLQLSSALSGEPFLLVAGDNIIEADLNRFIGDAQAKGCTSNLLYRMRTGQEASQYGVGIVDRSSGLLSELREKEEVPSSILISTACYRFLHEDAMRLKSFLNDPSVASQNIGSFIAWLLTKRVPVAGHVTDDHWFDIGTREKLLRANAHYLRDRRDGVVEDTSQVKGPFILEAGARVTGNSIIGPNVYVGRGVTVGGGSEVRNSIVMEGAQIMSASVSNSVIGAKAHVQGLIESFLVCNGAHVVREQGGYN